MTAQILRQDITATVMGFDRENYPGTPLPPPTVNLGTLRSGSAMTRLLPYSHALLPLARELKRCEAVFVMSLDLLLLTRFASALVGAKPFVAREFADIHAAYGKRHFGSIFRMLEAIAERRTDVLAVTSRAFEEEFFRQYWSIRHRQVATTLNTVDPVLTGAPDPDGSKIADARIRICYTGLIRCRRTLEILSELSKRHSDRFQVDIWGFENVHVGLSEVLERTPTLRYHGPFEASRDLRRIYSDADIVWACYPHAADQNINTYFARTNRFNEALYFGKPVICLAGTQDARWARETGSGLVIQMDDVATAVEEIAAITQEHLEAYSANLMKLPKHFHTYCGQHRFLLESSELDIRVY